MKKLVMLIGAGYLAISPVAFAQESGGGNPSGYSEPTVPSTSLYVSNISYTATEEDLRKPFEAYGEVLSANIVRDMSTNESKGYGFVRMASEKEANAALQGLNRMGDVGGRTISVAKAHNRPSSQYQQSRRGSMPSSGQYPQGGYGNIPPSGQYQQGGYGNVPPSGQYQQGGYGNVPPSGQYQQGGYSGGAPSNQKQWGGASSNQNQWGGTPSNQSPQGEFNGGYPSGQYNSEDMSNVPAWRQRRPEKPESKPSAPGASLHVTNISYNATDADLRKTFEAYGEVLSAKIVRDMSTNKSKGYGFVRMASQKAADTARQQLHSIGSVGGRTIFVYRAHTRR